MTGKTLPLSEGETSGEFQPGTLEYKCNLCGCISPHGTSPHVLKTLAVVMRGEQSCAEKIVRMYGGVPNMVVHSCADGGYGIAEFVGVRPNK